MVTSNRRAFHDFHILESVEAGIVLTGTEIKSIRDGKATIAEAYARASRMASCGSLAPTWRPTAMAIAPIMSLTGRASSSSIAGSWNGCARRSSRRV